MCGHRCFYPTGLVPTVLGILIGLFCYFAIVAAEIPRPMLGSLTHPREEQFRPDGSLNTTVVHVLTSEPWVWASYTACRLMSLRGFQWIFHITTTISHSWNGFQRSIVKRNTATFSPRVMYLRLKVASFTKCLYLCAFCMLTSVQ